MDPGAPGEPPAALLRRAISHVESLLHRLDPDELPDVAEAAEHAEVLDEARAEAALIVEAARTEAEDIRAAARAEYEQQWQRRDSLELLSQARETVDDLRATMRHTVDVLNRCLDTLDASAGAIAALLDSGHDLDATNPDPRLLSGAPAR